MLINTTSSLVSLVRICRYSVLLYCICYARTAAADVCFLPDSENCGEITATASGLVIPCDYTSCSGIDYDSTYQECYKSGQCAYTRCLESTSVSGTLSGCQKLLASSGEICQQDSKSGCWYVTEDTSSTQCGEEYTLLEATDNCVCSSCTDSSGTTWYYCPESSCSGPRYTCAEMSYTLKGACTADCIETAANITGTDGECVICTQKTCAQINSSYQTNCAAGESLISTGVSGSDGPCVTCGTCNTDSSDNTESCTGTCREVKYIYFQDQVLMTNDEGGTLNQVALYVNDEEINSYLGYSDILYFNYDTTRSNQLYPDRPIAVVLKGTWTTKPKLNSSSYIPLWSSGDLIYRLYMYEKRNQDWDSGISYYYYNITDLRTADGLDSICGLTFSGPNVDYQIKCVSSEDEIELSVEACEAMGYSTGTTSCSGYWLKSCPGHSAYKKCIYRALSNCKTYLDGETAGCASCASGKTLNGVYCE